MSKLVELPPVATVIAGIVNADVASKFLGSFVIKVTYKVTPPAGAGAVNVTSTCSALPIPTIFGTTVTDCTSTACEGGGAVASACSHVSRMTPACSDGSSAGPKTDAPPKSTIQIGRAHV